MVLAGVAVMASASLVLVGCGSRAQPETARSEKPAGGGDAAGQREDLEAFERDFFNVDRSYSKVAREAALQRIADLRKNAGSVSPTLFVLRLAQIAALADNGHTLLLDAGNAASPGVGIRLSLLDRDYWILQAASAHADLLGGRLIAIDDTPLDRLRETARTLWGGIESRRDQRASTFLESPSQLYALGMTKRETMATYHFMMRDGSVRITELGPDPTRSWVDASRVMVPEIATKGWQTLLATNLAPWSLCDVDDAFRLQDQPALDALVVQLRANRNAGRSIAEFLDEAEATRKKAGRKNVILDVRMNGGGNLQLTRKWMSEFPAKLPPNGRVVVLTSPWTFSAAISSIGYLKQAGGARVIIAGEPVGDRLQFWAEGQPIVLPHSAAVVLMAIQRHDYVGGCKTFSDCHEYVVNHPIAVPNLDPDVLAPWTIDAYMAGRDPGMEAAARILTRPR